MFSRYRVLYIVTGAVILWFSVGALITGNKQEKTRQSLSTQEMASQVPLQVKKSIAQEKSQKFLFYGYTEANAKLLLKAEVSGRIEDILVSSGTAVTEGTPLVRIALGSLQEKVASTKAKIEELQYTYEGEKKLVHQNFRSKISVAQIHSQLKQAEQAYKQALLDLHNTTPAAPFSGVLESYAIDLGSYVRPGDPIATFMDLDPLQVIIDVSEQEYTHMYVGQSASVTLANGQKYPGKINYIARLANDKTRTFTVKIGIDNPNNIIPSGLSCEVLIKSKPVHAHGIPAHILTLDDAGDIGVKILAEKNLVRFYPVKVLHSSGKYMWVTGLPSEVLLITQGQELVRPHERILDASIQEEEKAT